MRLLKYYFDCHIEDGEAIIIGYSASLKLGIITIPYSCIIYKKKSEPLFQKQSLFRGNMTEGKRSIVWENIKLSFEGTWEGGIDTGAQELFSLKDEYIKWHCTNNGADVKINWNGKEYTGKGVHYCSTCDGPFYKGLDVAVIGGGNSGVEAAIDLSGIAKSVTLIEFMPEMKADKVLQDKLAERENIKVILNSATKEVIGKEFVESIKYVDRATEKEHDLKVNGMFIEIGLSPRSELVKDLVEINKIGEIEINNENNMTSVKGIFAAGDVTTVKQKQIIIAMGEGAKAALGAFEYVIKEY